MNVTPGFWVLAVSTTIHFDILFAMLNLTTQPNVVVLNWKDFVT